MVNVFIVVGLILAVLSSAGVALYFYMRHKWRVAKNYERGLKMVPMLINLPPPSDDTEVGGRDEREVADQVISEAQTLYNILASTVKTGFKSKFYGQRHISFEIIASQGAINYYVVAPVAIQDVVRQAVVSAYPTAVVEETSEHNLFSQVGMMGGTIGGEFELKEDYANPIATYQETKRDAMEVILNALSGLSSDDGVGVQLMIRPAFEGWSKNAISVAKDMSDTSSNKGSGAVKNLGELVRQVPGALSTVPEGSDGNKTPDPKDQVTKLEQSNIDAIEDKTRYPGYESLLRIVVSSNTAVRSQSILSSINAAFAVFDAPGKNGLKFVPAKDMESFVTAFIFRFFPQHINKNILNSVELATIFHLPDRRLTPTNQVSRQRSKQVDGPRDLPEDGLLIGYNEFRGTKKEIRISPVDRRRHMYILGQTGTGKTVLLQNLVLQDMYDGRGLAYIDPHGDAAEELLQLVPKDRVEDVVYFDPGDTEHPMGLNLFEYKSEDQKDFLIQESIKMLEKLYDPNNTGIIGPRYHHIFRNCALLLMSDPRGSSFVDITKLMRDESYVQEKLQYCSDPTVIEFWTKEMPQSQRSNDFGEVKAWFVSKFGAFLSNEMMRNVIGQTKSSFDLRDIMDQKKILIVNLSKGRMGELNSKLLGMIFIMQLQAAAMSRSDTPEDERVDFSLYVDEFQNFLTDSIATILSEARKYRLSMVMAHQFIGQLTEDIREAVFGNVGSYIIGRASPEDADFLMNHTKPIFDTDDIINMPNYSSITKTLTGGVPTQPFSMGYIPLMGEPNVELGKALRRLSSAKYGRPKALVAKEIMDRLNISMDGVGSPIAQPGIPSGVNVPPRPGGLPQQPAAPPQPAQSIADSWRSVKSKAVANPQVPPNTQVPAPTAATPPLPASSAPNQQPPASTPPSA